MLSEQLLVERSVAYWAANWVASKAAPTVAPKVAWRAGSLALRTAAKKVGPTAAHLEWNSAEWSAGHWAECSVAKKAERWADQRAASTAGW